MVLVAACGRIGTLFIVIFGVAAAAAARAAIPDIAAGVWPPATVVVTAGAVCCCCCCSVVVAVAEATNGERIRMTLLAAILGVIGLVGFCTTCGDTAFCTGLCTVDCTRNGVVGVTADLTEVGVVGREAIVVTGGDVTGTVAGAATAAVVTAVLGVDALTGGKAPLAAVGGMSYFCI